MEKLTEESALSLLRGRAKNGETYFAQVFPVHVYGSQSGIGIAIQKGELRHAVRYSTRPKNEDDFNISKEKLFEMRDILVDWLKAKEAHPVGA